MKQLLVAATAGIAVLAGSIAFGGTANAVPIAAGSTMNITGSSSFTATNVTFVNPASSGVDTGDFTVFSNCNQCATMTNFTWSPFTAGQIYTITFAGWTSTLSVTSQVSAVNNGTSLDITDNAVMTLVGNVAKDPTPGVIVMTFNQLNNTVTGSFSSTAAVDAVPEPMTLALFGTGLLGLGLTQLKRKSS